MYLIWKTFLLCSWEKVDLRCVQLVHSESEWNIDGVRLFSQTTTVEKSHTESSDLYQPIEAGEPFNPYDWCPWCNCDMEIDFIFFVRFHWEEYLTVLANTLARIEAIQDCSTTSDALKALMGTSLSQQGYQHHWRDYSCQEGCCQQWRRLNFLCKFETSRITNYPIEHNSAIGPRKDISGWNMKYSLDVVEKCR